MNEPPAAAGARPIVSMKSRILVVDDNVRTQEAIALYLRHAGYEVLTASNGPDALAAAAAQAPDLILLDLMLPGLSGLDVCRTLRARTDVPIIMVTARVTEDDTLEGLGSGADDYVTKPFSPRELVARIRAMLRRPRGGSAPEEVPPVRAFGPLTVDEARHEVSRAGQPIALTAREFALLAALAAQPGRVFTREQLLERVWGDAYYDDHVGDGHVANLRKKLEPDPARPRYVETVRGVGYRVSETPSEA